MQSVFLFTFVCAFSVVSFAIFAEEGVVASSVQMMPTEKRELLFAHVTGDGHRFWENVNKRAPDLRPGSDEEKDMAKEAWYEMLGFDPFVPYYEAQKIEDAVEEKTKVKVWKFSGKADFDTRGEKANYVFRHQF
jgi:hypothetical protein